VKIEDHLFRDTQKSETYWQEKSVKTLVFHLSNSYDKTIRLHALSSSVRKSGFEMKDLILKSIGEITSLRLDMDKS
jgi:hypothetical protein